MDQIFIEKNQQRLEQEKARLEKLLSNVAVADKAAGDFHAKYPDVCNDEESNANEVEQYAANIAEGHDLETKLHQVEKALGKIANGTYGICAVGGEEIPVERLEAVPEAETCVQHASAK